MGLEIPLEERIVQESRPKKKPRKRKKKPLEIDTKSKRLFESISKGLLRDIVSFTPSGTVELIRAGSIEEIVIADANALLEQQEGEDDTTFALRTHITQRLNNIPDLELTPDTVILLGYLVTKKVAYGVRFAPQVEVAIHYALSRV